MTDEVFVQLLVCYLHTLMLKRVWKLQVEVVSLAVKERVTYQLEAAGSSPGVVEPHPNRGELLVATLRSSCKQGVANRPISMDLSGANLAHADLSGLDLSAYDFGKADLSGADLSGSNLSFCNLSGANLYKANLTHSEFLRADLSGANMNECTAEKTGFGAANLTDTSLVGADLRHATLSEANLLRADARAANLQGSSLRQSNLEDTNLTRSNLKNSDMKQSSVKGANFHNADLSRARLLGLENYANASWVGADIRDVDFRGSYMILRFIRDENYLFEFKTRSKYHKILYYLWWATSDCGRSLVRWALCILLVALMFAFLYSLVEVDYGDYKTPFSPFYYSIVTLTTLGYGDVQPASLGAQIFAMAEACLGYVGLGGLLSILSNRIARRAE